MLRNFHCLQESLTISLFITTKNLVYSRDQMSDKLKNSTQPVGRRVGAARRTGLETLYFLVKFGFVGWIVRLTCSRLQLS